ncbi:hypothetical protein HO483_04845 [Streptococcus suis]|uniref:hypothetical protein n=1 Tax=Streptococcus parasuis TaxID=1501662 RepID=UPI001552CA57|nr:hypothetical protein [Streptococcus suis]WNF87397.1 hypothetical protein RJW51_04620 [Streptococcus parasuis]
MSDNKLQQIWSSAKTSEALIERLKESDSLEYIDKNKIFSCIIYKEAWDEVEKTGPNGIRENIKTAFTNKELSDITGLESSNGSNINFVFIGISSFGDIIEVGKSSVDGDWANKIYFEKGVSSEYLEYIIEKTLESSPNLESSPKMKAKELLNILSLNLNKFYERMIILPIISDQNTDDDIAIQMEKVVGNLVIPFINDNKNIKFVRPNSHNGGAKNTK